MNNSNTTDIFFCKEFQVIQEVNKMKVNTDAMLLGAWSSVKGKNSIIDIGTGTGIIALMLAQRNPVARILGIEIEQGSASEAKRNFEGSVWSENLDIQCQSIQEFSRESNEKYDLLVSNPPFFTGGTLSLNENKNNVKHTTRLSHGDLLISVSRLMKKGGHFDVILPYIEGERFIELARRYNLFPERITEVRSRVSTSIERLLISFTDRIFEVERETLIMFKEGVDRDPTDQYRDLLGSFYLKY